MAISALESAEKPHDAPMRVFVLCTGRCGSKTFATACQHMTNFTVGHEMLSKRVGSARLAYPEDHIEVDNRLSWFLGRLDRLFGDGARYVHLTRERDAVAKSLNATWPWETAIMPAYRDRLLKGAKAPNIDFCYDYIDTVTENILAYLKDKTEWMSLSVESAEVDFARFWEWIEAKGDLNAALGEWRIKHNSTEEREARRRRKVRDLTAGEC